ncbi:viral A-type inclusion protein [Dyadobacter subterraneus]|uniref:Viral A-type inclusion protein n=1 Tax=Dyadobacter subterraneus TaxID=2773304 RepID=A0ABR9WJ03_9BACT|nr:viral A-type inclusion protein [Dyadobacter subterraneus]MBE9464331.1 viral A-type inclusion protein [Dyadobacter subterraneus]
MKQYVLALGITFSFLSCNKDADKVLELEGEVMTIHDEVMPQMDDIMTLKSRLSQKIIHMDSLQNEGVAGNNIAEERIKATEINQKLNESDKLMMDWMHEYRGDSAKKLKPEAAILYFETQKKRIIEVKEITSKNIQEAKTFLN